MMATYLMLFRYTHQGMIHIQESPARIEAAKHSFQALGAEVKAPDDATIARATLALGALGNVHSETLRAFTEEEYRQVVAGLL